ncbi:MAG: flavin reductase family protein [Nitrospirota bacterium]|nr:flavin reductase family protein [Nitrospirota bacterium]
MDEEAKKTLLRKIPYGLFIAGSKAGEEVSAGTINWLAQASFRPPMLMVALQGGSRLHSLAEASKALAVSFLKQGQQEIASAFFRPSVQEGDKINGHRFTLTKHTASPVIEEAFGWVETRVFEIVKRGDHSVFVVEVIDAALKQDEPLMTLTDTPWHYGG